MAYAIQVMLTVCERDQDGTAVPVFVAVLNILRKESSPDPVKFLRKIFLSLTHTHKRARALA